MSNVYPISSGIEITIDGDDTDVGFDEATNTTTIPLEDGTVEVSFGPPAPKRRDAGDFEENLAESLGDSALSTIAERVLNGIELDKQSRQEWLENMSNGMSLLGLQVKNPRGAAASGASPAEGTSTVDHPLLLEAVLRFQANARGELLPTDGPVKVRSDGTSDALADTLAKALEKDMNHYLTKVATEYYPDTDRMLLQLGFCGISFKKGYHDPIKRRPVIASIDAKDLIVSNTATDLEGAGRVTHRIMMKPSTLRRMQLLGAYCDGRLMDPGTPALQNPVDTKISQIQGIAPPTYAEPGDQDRELYECYTEIDIPGFEHTIDGKVTGLPLPYKVTIDVESRRVLEIRRNWHEDDEFCLPRNRIIAYTFIPGFGFYGIGLLNVLGNAAKAVTAAWRLMIDSGMYANFPGFLYLKSLAKQLTNQFRIPPGGGMPIDTVGNDIRASVMPLPYKDPSAVFIDLIKNIAETAQRVGGTAELQIGEGKQDAPVGSTLAMIEQATKLMSAVHKRCHQAQGQELDMLKSLLMEDPEALWRHNKKSKVLEYLRTQHPEMNQMVNAEDGAELRHRELFLAALADCELIPRADPNTSSQTERYLKIMAMRQMATTNQSMDLNAVDERALRTMGVDDPESLFKPPPPPGSGQPSPEEVTANATMMAANARLIDSRARLAESATKAQNAAADRASKEKISAQNLAKELVIHNSDAEKEANKQAAQGVDRSQDRMHKLAALHATHRHQQREGIANRAHERFQALNAQRHEGLMSDADRRHDGVMSQMDMAHDHIQGDLERSHATGMANLDMVHEARQNALDRRHEIETAPPPGVAP